MASTYEALLFAQLDLMLHPPDFSGYQATVQSIPNGTETAVSLDSNSFDTYSGHSNTVNNSRYTAPIPGTYVIGGQVAYAPNATGVRAASLRVNGTTDVIASQTILQSVSSSGVNCNVSTRLVEVVMNVGDYIELMGTQTSGAALNTQTGGNNTSGLVVRWVHY